MSTSHTKNRYTSGQMIQQKQAVVEVEHAEVLTALALPAHTDVVCCVSSAHTECVGCMADESYCGVVLYFSSQISLIIKVSSLSRNDQSRFTRS